METSNNLNTTFGRFIGTSPIMQNIYAQIERLAPTNTPIFITGEAGTEKETCAQMIHTYSDQHNQPFLSLNCAALPKGCVESELSEHENGTLFLDKIDGASLESQAKILKLYQNRTRSKTVIDNRPEAILRLICAGTKNIKSRVNNGLFREDLYDHLCATQIMIPPLRKQQTDILDIAYYYLKQYAEEQNKSIKSFSENAEQILLNYDWPGNVRELQNTIHQIVSLEKTSLILSSMLPDKLTKNTIQTKNKPCAKDNHISLPLWKIEQNAIEAAINMTKGNIPKAAEMLDVAPSTIYRKLKLWEKT